MEKIEINSLQQETALKEHKEYLQENYYGNPLTFWEFYSLWCEENGLFNDRASYQY
jgi:hypothetical protein